MLPQRISLLVISIAVMFGNPSASAEIVPPNDCDAYAADDLDPQRKSVGMPINDINPSKAMPSCVEAVKRHPNVPRFHYQLGRAYAKIDYHVNAIVWYRKAAEAGYAPAQSNLASLYAEGLGVTKDQAQAVAWYRKAAEQGDARAQLALGNRYSSGLGIPKDDTEAVAWYQKAAEQGVAKAQNNLGRMYAKGLGVAKDEAQAIFWYRKAAEQGNEVARRNLATRRVVDGKRLPEDRAIANASVILGKVAMVGPFRTTTILVYSPDEATLTGGERLMTIRKIDACVYQIKSTDGSGSAFQIDFSKLSDRYSTGQHELTIYGAQGAVCQVFSDGKRCYDRIGIAGGTAEDRATIRFVQDGENDCGPYSVSVGSR